MRVGVLLFCSLFIYPRSSYRPYWQYIKIFYSVGFIASHKPSKKEGCKGKWENTWKIPQYIHGGMSGIKRLSSFKNKCIVFGRHMIVSSVLMEQRLMLTYQELLIDKVCSLKLIQICGNKFLLNLSVGNFKLNKIEWQSWFKSFNYSNISSGTW